MAPSSLTSRGAIGLLVVFVTALVFLVIIFGSQRATSLTNTTTAKPSSTTATTTVQPATASPDASVDCCSTLTVSGTPLDNGDSNFNNFVLGLLGDYVRFDDPSILIHEEVNGVKNQSFPIFVHNMSSDNNSDKQSFIYFYLNTNPVVNETECPTGCWMLGKYLSVSTFWCGSWTSFGHDQVLTHHLQARTGTDKRSFGARPSSTTPVHEIWEIKPGSTNRAKKRKTWKLLAPNLDSWLIVESTHFIVRIQQSDDDCEGKNDELTLIRVLLCKCKDRVNPF